MANFIGADPRSSSETSSLQLSDFFCRCSQRRRIMLFRFLPGVFSASTMAVIGDALAHFWDPMEREPTLGSFSGLVFTGPVAGPIAGGFIVMNQNLGWLWRAYMKFVLEMPFWLIALILCSESYALSPSNKKPGVYLEIQVSHNHN
ncbi:hypothetical protein BDR22DRAFT_656767 [Usnea florida]